MTPDDRSPRAPIGQWALELLALSGLAVAQPLFDVLSRQTAFFVAHQSSPAQIVAFALAIYLLPPLLLIAALALLWRLAPTIAAGAQSLMVVVLVILLLLAPLNRLGWSSGVVLATAVLPAVVVAVALRHLPAARQFAALLALLTLVLPLRFLIWSPVVKLVRPERVAVHEVEIGNPVPLVVLILDELPLVSLLDGSRSIDADLFPNFAALAARSHWFRNATAVSPLTDFAVPAILTGQRPRQVAPIASEFPGSLFTLLGGRYELEVVEPQTQICPPQLCADERREAAPAGELATLLADSAVVYLHVVIPRDLAAGLPAVSTAWGNFLGAGRPTAPDDSEVKLHIWAADRRRDFDRFLDSLRPDAEPRLYVLHAMLPHVPWVYLPSGREYWGSLHSSAHAPGVAADTTWTADQWQVDQAYQRHLAQVVYVDSLVGRLLARLEETGMASRALLIVVSDHGFSFRSGQPGRHPTSGNYADIMAVPLFISLPGQDEPHVSDRNVETVDVLATIAEVLEAPLPFATDGESVFSTGPERPSKIIAATPRESLTFSSYGPGALDESLGRKLRVFADGLFSIGAHPELLGQSVERARAASSLPIQVRLDQADHFRDIDPAGSFVPAQIFGRLRRASTETELTLAVAVNGVVRAVTRAFDERDGERFVALVPEESFRPGSNDIEIFVVLPEGDGIALHPTERSDGPTYAMELVAPDGVARLVGSDGSVCVLDAGAVEGGFERQGTAFVGWARDTAGRRPYVVVMAFADDQLVYTGATGARPPVGSAIADRPGYEAVGFQFVLPAALLDRAERLRIFAVLGERGTELQPTLETRAVGGAASG